MNPVSNSNSSKIPSILDMDFSGLYMAIIIMVEVVCYFACSDNCIGTGDIKNWKISQA